MTDRNPLRALLPAALLVAFSVPAAAHEFWLLPSDFQPEIGARVSIRIFVGDGFENGRPYARNPNHIKEFRAIGEAGWEVGGQPGTDPAGELVADAAGTLIVAYRSHPSVLTLEADQFEAYLAAEGLEHISRARAEKGRTGEPGREAFSRCAKTLVRVGGSPDGWDRRAGLDLEIVPEASPYELAPDGVLPVRVLWKGEGLAGAQLRGFLRGHPERTFETRTGDDGRVRLELATPGVWMLSVVHMEAAEGGSDADWESTWSSLSLEIGEMLRR